MTEQEAFVDAQRIVLGVRDKHDKLTGDLIEAAQLCLLAGWNVNRVRNLVGIGDNDAEVREMMDDIEELSERIEDLEKYNMELEAEIDHLEIEISNYRNGKEG